MCTVFIFPLGLLAYSPVLAYTSNTVPYDETNVLSDQTSSTLTPLDSTVSVDREEVDWVDNTHGEVQGYLGKWANEMNGWFGEPDTNDPATANLRVVLDTRWIDDPIEGNNVTFEPRIRGKIRLPVLERQLSLLIGDADLDEEALLKQDPTKRSLYSNSEAYDKTFDGKKTREDNAGIALRWSKFGDKLGLETDVDVGIRSGDDVYIKVSADKIWYEANQLTVSNDNYYQYGSDSEHTVKGELNLQYQLDPTKYINNNSTILYRNEDKSEETGWANELRHVHFFMNNKQLSYGVSAYGEFEGGSPSLNSYGPTFSYRQPIWKEWLYLQTEMNYYNNKAEDKEHYPSALLRIEALF